MCRIRKDGDGRKGEGGLVFFGVINNTVDDALIGHHDTGNKFCGNFPTSSLNMFIFTS